MGRVTIFTLNECGHCRRAKAALTARGIPYVEISLSSYPQKRSDMVSLSNRTSVPQIFFNDVHVGGATELLDRLAEWGDAKAAAERYRSEIASAPDDDALDTRLSVPTEPPVKETPAPPRTNDGPFTTFGLGTSFRNYVELHRELSRILPRGNVRTGVFSLSCVPDSFRGSDAVAAVVEEYGVAERERATAFLDRLLADDVVVRADGQRGRRGRHAEDRFRDDRNRIYRLPAFEYPGTLNSLRVWKDRVDPDAVGTVIRLKKRLFALVSRHTKEDDDGGLPDLVAVGNDPAFLDFEEATCELRAVDLSSLTTSKNDDDDDDALKKAFWINLYNLGVEHAAIRHGVAVRAVHRGAFFSRVGYEIGGSFFSFNDMEHGVLRANARPPYALSKPFSSSSDRKDPRFSCQVARVDARIHFALNCGARSCPPVKTFRTESVEEELRVVAESFVEDDDNVRVTTTTTDCDGSGSGDAIAVKLSRILDWYGGDFARNRSELPARLAELAREGTEKKEALRRAATATAKVSISFNAYDWSANASRVKTFDPASVRKRGSS